MKFDDRRLIKAIQAGCTARGWTGGEGVGLAIAKLWLSSGRPSAKELKAVIPNDFLTKNRVSRTAAFEAIRIVVDDFADATPLRPTEDAGLTIDIVVVTALPLEADAVCMYLDHVSPVVHPTTGTIYRTGRLRFGNRSSVAVVVGTEGNPAAAAETDRALEFFHPLACLFVGVAGGIKDDVSIGDVVVASFVYDYAAAKEGDDIIQARIKTYPAGYAIGQRAQYETSVRDWTNNIAPQYLLDGESGQVFFKPIAAGPRLITSTSAPMAQWIKQHCGDALAIEMEGFGFLHAAHAFSGVEALVVRGVSDLVDGKNASSDVQWQPVAAGRAAAFALTTADQVVGAARKRGK